MSHLLLGHRSCLDFTVDMMSHIRKYAWHCTDCKLCAQCNDTADEDKMLFCDMCDRGYHFELLLYTVTGYLQQNGFLLQLNFTKFPF